MSLPVDLQMTEAEFLRVHAVRVPNLMWFLGAGASAAARVPTATDLVWDFKRALYCAAQRVSINSVDDLGSPTIQRRLQQYFDGVGSFPPAGSAEEYTFYFEAAYQDAGDRRRILDKFISGAIPSFGHRVLATLMKVGRVRVVWTTNFDRTIEDAVTTALGSSARMTVATLDSPRLAIEALNEDRWPLIGKLHGDFQSRRLKNISDELQYQDAELRHALIESCHRYGLVVVGYSGRDNSIMDALEEAMAAGRGFPAGLFWFYRSDTFVQTRVVDLISKAAKSGIHARLVEVATFDELLGDIVRQLQDFPAEVLTALEDANNPITDVQVAQSGTRWPIIRSNALPFVSYPETCRRIVAEVGGTKDVRERIAACNAHVVAARRKAGILAFGSDTEIRKAFSKCGITEFDFQSLEVRRLRYESAELGLIREAFCKAVVRVRPLLLETRRGNHLLRIDEERAADPTLQTLRSTCGSLNGTVSKTSTRWAEAIRIKIEFRFDKLWMLVEPTIWFSPPENADMRFDAADFVRERTATRYNRKWNSILEAWIGVLLGNEKEGRFALFGINDGADAVFVLNGITGFSRRQ